MIQALVIFFVGAELLIVYIWRARSLAAPRLGRAARGLAVSTAAPRRRRHRLGAQAHGAADDRDHRDRLRGPRASGSRSRPWTFRSIGAPARGRLRRACVRHRGCPARRAEARLVGDRPGPCGHARRDLAADEERGHPRQHPHDRRDRRDAPLRDPARVRRDGRDLLRALRRREHRPRGDDADGRLLRRLGLRLERQLGRRAC